MRFYTICISLLFLILTNAVMAQVNGQEIDTSDMEAWNNSAETDTQISKVSIQDLMEKTVDEANESEAATTDLSEVDDESESSESNSTDFDKRTIDDESWEKVTHDKGFIYKKERTSKEEQSFKASKPKLDLSGIFNATVFKAILYLLVIAFVFMVLWYIIREGDFSYLKSKRKEKTEIQEGDWENVEEFTEWEKALQHALSKNDYRLATRILYKELIQKMSQRNLINYKAEFTNWDYVNQLFQSHHLDTFTKLTKYFDYVWYGSFSLDATQFEEVRKEFSSFKNLIT